MGIDVWLFYTIMPKEMKGKKVSGINNIPKLSCLLCARYGNAAS